MNLQFTVQNGAQFPKTRFRFNRIVQGTPSSWSTDEFIQVTAIIRNPSFKVTRVELAHEVDNITFIDDEGNTIEVEPNVDDLFYLSIFLDHVKEAEEDQRAKEAKYEAEWVAFMESEEGQKWFAEKNASYDKLIAQNKT